jgi:zinc protease
MPFAALNSRAGRSTPVLQSLMPATLALLLLVAAPLARAMLPIQHWVQPSGARVYLIESPSIPMVDVQIDFDAGQRRAPQDRIGLLSAMTSMLYSGLAPRDPGRHAPHSIEN